MKNTQWSFVAMSQKSKQGNPYSRMIVDRAELQDILKEMEDSGHDRLTLNILSERESKAGNLYRAVKGSTWKADPAKAKK